MYKVTDEHETKEIERHEPLREFLEEVFEEPTMPPTYDPVAL